MSPGKSSETGLNAEHCNTSARAQEQKAVKTLEEAHRQYSQKAAHDGNHG